MGGEEEDGMGVTRERGLRGFEERERVFLLSFEEGEEEEEEKEEEGEEGEEEGGEGSWRVV